MALLAASIGLPAERFTLTKHSKNLASLIISIRDSETARFKQDASACSDNKAEIVFVSRGKQRRIKCQPALIQALCSQGLLICRSDGLLSLTAEAANWLTRQNAAHNGQEPFRAQQGEMRQIKLPLNDHRHCAITIVDSENPLAWLARRKDKSGEPFLSTVLVEAGERLRADFTRGCMEQSVTMNWSASLATQSGTGGVTGAMHISDNALDARARVAQAVAAVGPELCNPLLDVCCYLKSITDVEKSREWPVRSGKLILKMGLQALARHYGLIFEAPYPASGNNIRQHGAENYRPSL